MSTTNHDFDIEPALRDWGLTVQCPTHQEDVVSATTCPSDLLQFRFMEVEYGCGCWYRRTPFELKIHTPFPCQALRDERWDA